MNHFGQDRIGHALFPSWSYSAHKINLAILSKMISSSQMPCARSAIQSRIVAAQCGYCVAMSLLRAVQPRKYPIDKYLCQNRRELQAAANRDRRFSRWEEAYSLSSAVSMIEVWRACKQLSLRRSDRLRHIQFFKKRKLQPK